MKSNQNSHSNKEKAIKRAQKRERKAKKQVQRVERNQAKVKDLNLAFSKLNIPRNEQDVLQQIVTTSGDDEKTQLYVATLTAPKIYRSRVPDAYARKTALFGSVMTIDVMANFASTPSPDDGRFAMLINPHMGSLSQPHLYKVGLVNSAVSWPEYYNIPSSFVSTSNGKDIRMDTLALRLTQPPLSCASYLAGANQTAANPFGDSVSFLTGYGLNVDYAPNQSNGSAFYPPPGTYYVTVLSEWGFNNLIGSPIMTVTPSAGSTWLFNGALDNTLADGSNGKMYCFSGYFKCQPAASGSTGGSLQIIMAALPSQFNYLQISFVPIFSDNPQLSSSYDYGDVSEYRPVACSALFTASSSPLVTGGMITGAYLPSNASNTQFFGASTNPIGQLANWENLNQIPGSYNGLLKDGAYCWYSPADSLDVAMYTPNEVLEHKYPTLCIAGQLTPTGVSLTPPQSVMVGRLEVVTIYEGVTTSQLYDSQMMLGSQAIMDTVNRHLAIQPHSMQNKKHTDFQSHVIKTAPPRARGHGMPWLATAIGHAVPWAVQNRNGIGEALGMASNLIGSIL